jgi:hypothetical protein
MTSWPVSLLQLAPAVGGDFAVFGVEPHDDVAAKRGAGVLQKAGVFYRGGADDDVAQTGVEVTLNGVEVADAAAELYVDFAANFFEDFADGGFVLGLARKRAVEVHQVHTTRALVHPHASHSRRVLTKHGGLVHVALLEANTLAVFQINGRDQQHGRGGR